MKKFVFFLFIICLTASDLSAQNVVTDTSASVVAYWKKGDKKTFTHKKITEKSKEEKIKKDSATHQVIITVLDETDTSYTLEWRYQGMPSSNKTNKEVAGLYMLLNELRVLYKTDENGSFMEVINMDEVLTYLNKSFDLLLKNSDLNHFGSDAMDELKSILSSRQSVEILLLKDVQLFHTLYGSEYSSTKQSEDVELPNVIGGDPFPAVVSYRFTGFDKIKKSIGVEMDMMVDKKAATKMITEYLNSTSKKSGKPEIKPGEMPELNINDNYKYSIDQASGWPRSVHSVRLVNAMGSYSKETTIITMIPIK
jgi:hypothetical protein